jgi:hypothetical protein
MMTGLKPTNWNNDPDIADVANLNEQDQACLEEIKAVLTKPSRTARFGVTLLHSHFRLADDEVFLEHTDEKARTLVTSPIRFADIVHKHYRPTVWRFDGEKAQGCSYCPMDEDGNHHGYKEQC